MLELPHKRLPCYSTLRRAVIRVNFEAVTTAFNAWAKETVETEPGDAIAADGKSVRSAVELGSP